MSRVLVIIGVVITAVVFGWANLGREHQIIVSKATISRMMDGTIMMSVEIANAGEPDVLLGASAKGFGHVHFMGGQGDLVIPGNAAPVLAGDGAHIMMGGGADMAIGQLVPIDLKFKDAGSVTARAQIVAMTMDHSSMAGIEAADIDLTLRIDGVADRRGVRGIVDIKGLEIVSRADDYGHVDGEGHGHVYLNGLKLQRLYENTFDTGTLRAGDYLLRVTLNSNDHRPYLKDGAPISAEIRFEIK